MYTFLIVIHTLACLALITIVLLQKGKGADMGAAFGGASQTLFGGSGGSTFMGKLTTGAAVLFMLTCLSLSYFTIKPGAQSLMDQVEVEMEAEIPVHKGPAIPDPSPIRPVTEQPPEAAVEPEAEMVPESPAAALDHGADVAQESPEPIMDSDVEEAQGQSAIPSVETDTPAETADEAHQP